MSSDARARLLAAATDLMHHRGYEAVGVADLCASAGVKRGSFYHFFDSKQALALAMLDESWERTRSTVFDPAFGDRTIEPIEAVQRYGRLLATHQRRLLAEHGTVPGCRFGNLASELATQDEVIRQRVAAIFDEMIDLVASSVGSRPAATAIIAQMEGLMVLAKANRDPDLLEGLGEWARALLTPLPPAISPTPIS